jgi:DNA-directed RNA polymerase subunit beta
MAKKVYAVKDNKIQEVDDNEVNYELPSATSFFSTHVNLIPLQSAVQGPRLFYGARFFNQALPVKNSQAPLVQTLDETDPSGRSFDELMGQHAGASFADDDAEVVDKKPGSITLQYGDGSRKHMALYNTFPFNRKTAITQQALVNKGDVVKKGQVLARSNYTDDKGTLALGLNARVGLVPYQGYSFEDAVVVSQDFANRMASDHSYTIQQEFDNDIKGGLNHYRSLFPMEFNKNQLGTLDDDGVVKEGTVVQNGDPLVLATRPRVFSSTTAQLGKLSKAMRQSRHDSSKIWDEEHEGMVTDVAKTAKGVKVQVRMLAPTMVGDKVVARSGQKGVISKIVPTDQMPRTLDGKPLEVLLNPLGIPSRANNSLIYELLLGKVADKMGQPIKLRGFNEKGTKWHEIVRKYLGDAGLSETEEIFDPVTNRKLGQPVTVGVAHMLKLHHTSASKASARGQAGYDANQQPLKGGSEAAQAKRLSGLEVHALMSSGAYANLREGSTLRGQKNDEFWRALRSGQIPRPPGRPFVWDKFQALLAGAGMYARNIEGGRQRLGPFTDSELEARQPFEIKHGELVDINTLDPVRGGLFDQAVVGNNKWGKISLPFHVPNPAFEGAIRHLLGLTEKELRGILSGEMELPEHLR